MRRPSSSSCLLLPRGSSYDEGDSTNGLSNEASPTASLSPFNNSSNLLSVTIISKDKLPSYSSERFFLLAEVEVHAQPTTFLQTSHTDENCSLTTQASDETDDPLTLESSGFDTVQPLQPLHPTYPAVTPSSARALNSDFQDQPNSDLTITPDSLTTSLPPPWPPNVLLYLLWRPNQTRDPSVFTEVYILDAVLRLQEVLDLDLEHSTPNDATTNATFGFGQARTEPTDSTFHNGTSPYSLAAQASTPASTPASTTTTTVPISLRMSTEGIGAVPSTTQPESLNGNAPYRNSNRNTHIASTRRPKTALYIVVDRVMPVESGDEMDEVPVAPIGSSATTGSGCSIRHSHGEQEDLAEQLARAVASHTVLRGITQGISVGIANHVRAAPGLELCVQAITVGASDRRRHNSNTSSRCNNNNCSSDVTGLDPKRSLLGIVALSPSDLLGLQDASVTDAAQGVLQSKVTAEWNGKGDLLSFASRVHNQWRRRHGIPIPLESYGAPKRKIPRRINRRAVTDRSAARRKTLFRYGRGIGMESGLVRLVCRWCGTVWTNHVTKERLADVMALTAILSYVTFHFGTELVTNLTQMLTAWNDLIRSARGW